MLKEERVHRYMACDDQVRAAFVDGTSLVGEMQHLTSSYPLATVAVGRAMLASVLMASQLKEGQQVGLLFQGSGPLKSVFAEANREGSCRGYCPEPQIEVTVDDSGICVGKGIGVGILTVTQHLPHQGAPYQGVVELATGEIGDDVAYYLQQSHQIPSIVSLGVYVDEYSRVRAAGGALIELLPGADTSVIDRLEKNLENLKNISELIFHGASPQGLAREFLNGLKHREIPHPFPLKYQCKCSREKLKNVLELLGEDELKDILKKNEGLHSKCEFCGRQYEFKSSELQEILKKMST